MTVLLETLASMQEEKARLSLLVESLRQENKTISDNYKSEMEALRESYKEEQASMRQTIETLKKTITDMNANMVRMVAVNKSLSEQLADAMASGKLARGKRFAPTTEQRNLLNNRDTDRRGDDKDNFDGTPPQADSGNESASGSEPASGDKKTPMRTKKKSEGRKPSLEDYGCDRVERHALGDYFTLPEGACFKTRGGDVEIHEYVCYEFIPGQIVKHIYETASYTDASGDTRNTLPVEKRPTPVRGCPFSAEMLAYILVEKYGYHTPKNQIKRKLREMGVRFSKSTFVRYYHLAARALINMLEPIFRKAVKDTSYLMIDETCELVGVIDPDTNIAEYKKRYQWAFYNKAAGLVLYLYERGSRAREVVTGFLDNFRGSISTDFYNAYLVFEDDEKYPDIRRCACWSHLRRKWIEGLGVASDLCYRFIDEIASLFHYEKQYRNLDPVEREAKRRRFSLPVVNRIFAMARSVANDTVAMGRELIRKAIRYTLNQEQALRNFILDGNAEISNNEEEQRMKTIKLDLKNCQNIGSEDSAENAAFMHSLVESCRLCGKNPYEYLLALLRKLRDPLDDIGKRHLLPDRWVPEC